MAELYHGAVRFPASRRRAAPRIGYVPQLETIDWSFPVTVEQVVLMGLAAESGPFPWPAQATAAAMHDLLERLGIGDCAGATSATSRAVSSSASSWRGR